MTWEHTVTKHMKLLDRDASVMDAVVYIEEHRHIY